MDYVYVLDVPYMEIRINYYYYYYYIINYILFTDEAVKISVIGL